MPKYSQRDWDAIARAKGSVSYYCSKCHCYHRKGSKIGKQHKK